MKEIHDIDTWTYLFGPLGPTLLLVAQLLLFLVPAALIVYFLCRRRGSAPSSQYMKVHN